MGYTALYRKFRPITFSELVGQEHITRTLRNQIIADRVGHAYLFNGGRGTGKTSSAKILARAINCLNPKDGEPCNECEICKGALNGSLTDIVEMDAASNNSVEDIRSIREEVNFLPTKAKYRVYIIDEVHMLSPGAFNALLKTLEIVCKESNIEVTEGALKIIAVLAEGAMRDALSILERCVQDGENKIDEDKIKDLVGIPKITFVHSIVDAIVEYDIDKALASMDEILNQGKDLNNFLWEIIKYVKDVLIYKSSGKADLYSEEEISNIKTLSDKVTKEKLVDLIYELSNLENDMKWSTQKTIMFQAGIIKLCSKEVGTGGNVEERLEKIENYLKSGKLQVASNSNNYNSNLGYASNTVNSSPRMQVTQNINTASINGVEQNTNSTGTSFMAKQPVNTKKYSNDLSKSWPKIVNDLKQNGKIVLYTNLMNTRAEQVSDTTVEIKFQKGMTAFGKAVLDKQENIKELSSLVSMACGKDMQIRYVSDAQNQQVVHNPEDDIQKLAKDADIPFNIM